MPVLDHSSSCSLFQELFVGSDAVHGLPEFGQVNGDSNWIITRWNETSRGLVREMSYRHPLPYFGRK
jgi:hypothetical protein